MDVVTTSADISVSNESQISTVTSIGISISTTATLLHGISALYTWPLALLIRALSLCLHIMQAIEWQAYMCHPRIIRITWILLHSGLMRLPNTNTTKGSFTTKRRSQRTASAHRQSTITGDSPSSFYSRSLSLHLSFGLASTLSGCTRSLHSTLNGPQGLSEVSERRWR